MDAKQRCQSCGMPLGEGYYGTGPDGQAEVEYCKYCYRDGAFVEPELKLEQMIHRSVEQMTTEHKMNEGQATELAHGTLPHLKRWHIS